MKGIMQDKTTINSRRISKMYSNYNFYFFRDILGLREIKEIYIYGDDIGTLKLDKPWFDNVDYIDLENMQFRNSESLNGDIFYTNLKNKKFVKLFIPNTLAKFEKVEQVKGDGFVEVIDIYKSNSAKFNFHIARIDAVENKKLLTKMKNACAGQRKAVQYL